MNAMIDESRLEAMEYIRRMGGTSRAAIEFADFSFGFPKTMSLDDIYMSYMMAKTGPMDNTDKGDSK